MKVTKSSSKPRKLRQKLTDKYRLVIINEGTFEEKGGIKLSRLNVFVIGGVSTIILIVLTILLIAISPIKEYIPGYSSTTLKKKTSSLIYQTDSLKNKLAVFEAYIRALKPVFTGDIPYNVDSLKRKSQHKIVNYKKLVASKSDSLFREKVESQDRFPLVKNSQNKAKVVLFAPITGNITQKFSVENKHFALDIVAKEGTPVKATSNGTVIFAEWTAETGYVIIIEHPNELISVYKHNKSLLKEQGDFVKSGEVIATVGTTGEFTTGPHLHFELWNNGHPMDPENYIDFQ